MSELSIYAVDEIRVRWSTDGGMGNDRGPDDFTDAGCRIMAEQAFADIAALLAHIDAVTERVLPRLPR